MRIVVTGATGNIGSCLVRALAADPAVGSVVGVARRRPRLELPGVEWTLADLRYADLAGVLRGADVVVHLAWLFQPTHRPVLTWQANVRGGIRLFRAAVEAGVPALVHASSVGAYSPGPKDRAVDESWPTHGWPTAGYTREKAYLERVLDALELEHPQLRVARIRPGFVFRRTAASQQRRLFGGPLVPGTLARPGLLPVVPDLRGLVFQVLHTEDAADAFHRAALRPVRGAFNVAADPVVDGAVLAELLGARRVRVPVGLVRAGLAAAWRLHLVPASPELFDAVLRVPVMDTGRARTELGWTPRHTATDALTAFLTGLRQGAGDATPPLEPGGSGPLRRDEFASGVGNRP